MSNQQNLSADILAAMAGQGYERIEPPIMQPSGVFLDLSGEDIRRRLYLVQDPAGREACLRPDYTIPVCRQHLDGGAGDAAAYCYLGPVFRFRPGSDAPGEFIQAGMERYGHGDAAAEDAGIVAHALEIVRLAGIDAPDIRMGEPAIFMAFVAALGLAEPWPRRLRSGFGAIGGVTKVLDAGKETGIRDATSAALAEADPTVSKALVEQMVHAAGPLAAGGREASEIAERYLEQARLAAGRGIPDDARELLARVAGVDDTPSGAISAFTSIAADASVDVSRELDAFAARNEKMTGLGVDVDAIRFSAGFGRTLDYYTGFVFEMTDPDRPDAGPLVGGGRYDRLMQLLGAPAPVPAVGCAIWVERLEGAAS